MIRILAYSDLQAHPWQEGEATNRIDHCVDVIRRMQNLATLKRAHALVFNGDLFESWRTIRSDVSSRVYAQLLRPLVQWREQPIVQVFNAGNHDYYNGECTLAPLNLTTHSMHTVTKFSAPQGRRLLIQGDGGVNESYNIRFLPNGATLTEEDKGQWSTVAFVHGNISGCTAAHGVTLTQSDYPEWLFAETEDTHAVFNGHYHTPQDLLSERTVPIHVIGAPLRHNWNDIDDFTPRGCCLITYNAVPRPHVTVKRISFDVHYPMFLSQAKAHKARAFDFVRTTLPGIEPDTARTATDSQRIVLSSNLQDVVQQYVRYVGKQRGMPLKERKRLTAGAMAFLR